MVGLISTVRVGSNTLNRTMATEAERRKALEDIRENIARYGLHVYMVIDDITPRFAYTIGLNDSVGVELILAGAVFYMKDEILQIIQAIASGRVCLVSKLLDGAFNSRVQL